MKRMIPCKDAPHDQKVDCSLPKSVHIFAHEAQESVPQGESGASQDCYMHRSDAPVEREVPVHDRQETCTPYKTLSEPTWKDIYERTSCC